MCAHHVSIGTNDVLMKVGVCERFNDDPHAFEHVVEPRLGTII